MEADMQKALNNQEYLDEIIKVLNERQSNEVQREESLFDKIHNKINEIVS